MTVRSIPQGLAPLLGLLELEQPRLVTASDLAEYAREAGVHWPTNVISQRLRERGWLLALDTRGVWEFAPAARAGAFGSGDPFVELRAVLARNPGAPFAVAVESAAYLLGLASRRPDIECIGAPQGVRPPGSLDAYRLVRWSPRTQLISREGLPVWSQATLIVFMASRPTSFRDWPNVGEWLQHAVSTVDVNEIAGELAGRSAGSWARAAYLLDRGGAAAAATALLGQGPKGTGPHYLGDRGTPGRYHAAYDVIDSTGFEITSA